MLIVHSDHLAKRMTKVREENETNHDNICYSFYWEAIKDLFEERDCKISCYNTTRTKLQLQVKYFSIIFAIFIFVISVSYRSECSCFKCLNANLTLSPHNLHFAFPNTSLSCLTDCKTLRIYDNNPNKKVASILSAEIES